MADTSAVDVTITKVLASVVGAAVSLKFIAGGIVERTLMFVGAVASSYLGSPWAARHLGMQDAEGLVGLLLGLYSMPLMAKVYEVIGLINTEAIADKLVARVLRWMGF